MKTFYDKGVRSTASIGGHPLHPIMIAFPIAFLVGALVTDIAFWAGRDPFWAVASLWLVGAGLVTGVAAAALGLIDFFTIDRARAHRTGWLHFIGNVIVLVLAFVSLLMRVNDAEGAVLPYGLIISAVIAVILGFTGWYGGELSYRFKIGVIEPEEEPSSRPVHTETPQP